MQNKDKTEEEEKLQNPQIEQLAQNLVVANLVHEIRTPVQTIIGTLDLLSDTHLDVEQIEYIRQLRFASDVLLSLVNDIMDFSKISLKKITLENIPFNIKKITENTINLVSIEAFNKKLEIESEIDYSLPDSVFGDPKRIQQVLLNLLKNSIKFTQKGYILVKLSKKDENFVQFTIIDTGIGVPKDKQKNLFQPFFQEDISTSRKYGGTGLGLSISQKLVQLMNGQIGFYPNENSGSVFWFTIPFKPVKDKIALPKKLPIKSDTKILIVDNSQLAINSLEKNLNSLGLTKIVKTKNAKDAITALNIAAENQNPYEIAFIAMNMPEYDGWHLANDIKNDPFLASTKTFLLVPEGQMGANAKLKVLSWFNGYLYKPIQLEKLEELLKQSQKIKNSSEENEIYLNKNSQNNDLNFAKDLKILVVEDNVMNKNILVKFLNQLGSNPLQAENGKQAVEQVQKNPDIQIIIMDIQMPIMNGMQASIEIRKMNFNGVIIACSANNTKDDFIAYQNAGMNDILHKPFKREHVKTILDKWKSVFILSETTKNQLIDQNFNLNDELWDEKDFEDTVGHDWDLGRQILLDYTEQTQVLINNAKQSIQSKDFEQLDLIAHTLKGSSATISANQLFKLAENLNKAVKNQIMNDIIFHLNEFEKSFKMFMLATKKYNNKA